MRKSKRRRYRLKPAGFLVIITLVLALVFAVYLLLPKKDKPLGTISDQSSVPSAGTSNLPSSDPETLPTSNVSTESSDSSTVPVTSTQTSLPTSNVSNKSSDSSTVSVVDYSSAPGAVASSGAWNLILLGPDFPPLEADLEIKKTKFDSQYVDTRAAGAYTDMYNAAKANGITLFLRSGYRGMNEQRTNYNNEVNRHMNAGKSKEEAIKLTERFYTQPGRSEHHTGLAFDLITPEYHKNIYTLNRQFADTDAYAWLVKNCADYGFILRYPEDKTDITKINYEPWHYRYVGVEAAKYIMSNEICLEEYLESL